MGATLRRLGRNIRWLLLSEAAGRAIGFAYTALLARLLGLDGFGTLTLALVLFVSGWVILIVYNLLANILTAPSWLVLLVLVIGQQLYILSRLTLRLTVYASEMALYHRLFM